MIHLLILQNDTAYSRPIPELVNYSILVQAENAPICAGYATRRYFLCFISGENLVPGYMLIDPADFAFTSRLLSQNILFATGFKSFIKNLYRYFGHSLSIYSADPFGVFSFI